MTHQLRIHTHARERMQERRIHLADIEHACMVAPRARLQANGRWRLDGTDVDDEELTVIATIEPHVVVVTIF
jgi:hypothetical protein